jgi:hypothetical protein
MPVGGTQFDAQNVFGMHFKADGLNGYYQNKNNR